MEQTNLILQNVSLNDIRQIVKEEVQEATSSLKPVEGLLPTASSGVYLKRKETAEYLKVSLTTLWDLTKKGKLKSYSVGGCIRYKVEEINKALKGGKL